jgi:hypothetical protein
VTGALGLLVIAVIAAYGLYIRAADAPDVLARPLFTLPNGEAFDGWSLSHVLFFWVLGVLDPGRPLLYNGLGCAWEALETLLGQVPIDFGTGRVRLLGPADDRGAYILGRESPADDAPLYWYGKWSDPPLNALGYALGSRVA